MLQYPQYETLKLVVVALIYQKESRCLFFIGIMVVKKTLTDKKSRCRFVFSKCINMESSIKHKIKL